MKSSTKIFLGLGTAAVLSTAAFVGTGFSDDETGPSARGPERMHMATEHARGDGPHGPMVGPMAGPQGHMQRARFGPRGHGHFRLGEHMMEAYDTDKDGKLTQAEIDTARADRLAKFDADKDGTLNLQEYQALWLDAMRERMVDAFQAHDDDGDGKVTVAEFQKRFKNLVARLDRNDDGAYSPDDDRKPHEEFRRHHEGPRGRDL